MMRRWPPTHRSTMHNTKLSSFVVLPEEVGQRLDRYLVTALSELSRTHIQQLIASEAIQVNGRASKPGYLLRVGDEITVDQAATLPQTSQAQPNALPLDIVYED